MLHVCLELMSNVHAAIAGAWLNALPFYHWVSTWTMTSFELLWDSDLVLPFAYLTCVTTASQRLTAFMHGWHMDSGVKVVIPTNWSSGSGG